MATTAVLIERLAAAEQAYHDLMIAGAVRVVVDQNGERIEYTAATSARLAAYIALLKSQLGTDIIGPMRVFM